MINFDKTPAGPFSLTLDSSDLPNGTYQLTALFGTPPAPAAPLRIDNGVIVDYQPFTEIPAQTGYIFKLER
jgi:hypothetical protein